MLDRLNHSKAKWTYVSTMNLHTLQQMKFYLSRSLGTAGLVRLDCCLKHTLFSYLVLLLSELTCKLVINWQLNKLLNVRDCGHWLCLVFRVPSFNVLGTSWLNDWVASFYLSCKNVDCFLYRSDGTWMQIF